MTTTLRDELAALVQAVGKAHRQHSFEPGDARGYAIFNRASTDAKVALANHVLDQWGPILAALTEPGEAGEVPLGAIENGREHFRRLAEHYNFECEGGPLANCSDFTDLQRCFEHITDFIRQQAAQIASLTAREDGLREDAAQRIYEHYDFGKWLFGEKPTWTAGGNSDAQELARTFARLALKGGPHG